MLDKDAINKLREQVKTGVRAVSAPQLFPTPPDLADRMVELADIQPGDHVLEPSAGTGALLNPIYRKQFSQITIIELNVELARHLWRKYTPWRDSAIVYQIDFFDVTSCEVDKVVMNPPFENGADIKHIKHAYNLLKPGGRLVALCAAGPRQQKEFGHLWEILPPGTFKEQGTGVNVALVVMDK